MKRCLIFVGLLLFTSIGVTLSYAQLLNTREPYATSLTNSLSSTTPWRANDQAAFVRWGATRETRLASLTPTTPSVRAYGAKCDGVTDDTAAFNTAQSAVGVGSPLSIPTAVCLVAVSGDLTVTGQIIGTDGADSWYANNSAAPYTLLHPAAHNIILGSHGGLHGLRVTRQGLGTPTNLGQVIDETLNYGGTGILINGGLDTFVENVMVIGFNQGILMTGGERASFRRVRGDDTNFLAIDACSDTCFVDRLEAWPFLGAPYNIRPQIQGTAVNHVSSSGGLIEISFESPPTYPVKTGYPVKIKGVTGVPANGRWTATRIDDSHFTLQGSTFSGSYVSGGTVYIDSITRTGTAYLIKDTLHLLGLVVFGWDIGVHWQDTPAASDCVACFIDGASAGPPEAGADNKPIGMLVDGKAAQIAFTGGNIFVANAVEMNSAQALILNGNTILLLGEDAGINGAGVQVLAGLVFSTSNMFLAGQTNGKSAIYISDGASRYSSAQDFVDNGVIVSYQTLSTGCHKYLVFGIPAC
jgi:hypothetical protein